MDPKQSDKFVLKQPKDYQGNRWDSDLEEDDFVKPAWVVQQEQDFVLRQGKRSFT